MSEKNTNTNINRYMYFKDLINPIVLKYTDVIKVKENSPVHRDRIKPLMDGKIENDLSNSKGYDVYENNEDYDEYEDYEREDIVPEYVIFIDKDSDAQNIDHMKKELLDLGFSMLLCQIKPDRAYQYKDDELLAKKIDLSFLKDEPEKKNWMGIDKQFLELYPSRFQLLTLIISPITLETYNNLDKAKKDKNFDFTLPFTVLSFTGLFIFIIFHYFLLIYSPSHTSSLLSNFGMEESDYLWKNSFYFLFGVISILVSRELSFILTCKRLNLSIKSSYFAPFSPLSKIPIKKKIHIIKLASSRIFSGWLVSVLLLVFGMALSSSVAIIDIDNPELLEENVNRYNILTQVVKMIFFIENSTHIIILHPIAYAGYFGLILTFLSALPFPLTDGNKIILSSIKKKINLKKIISCFGLIALMISIGIFISIFFENVLSFILYTSFVAATMIFNEKKSDNLNTFKKDLEEDENQKTVGGKISLFILILIIVILFPISSWNNYFGYLN